MKIYLAHPWFHREEGGRLQERLESLGFEVVNPFLAHPKETESWARGERSLALDEMIVSRDLEEIRGCDVLVAYIPTPENTQNIPLGAFMEIFYCGMILKKPVLVLSDVPRVLDHAWIRMCGETFDSEEKLVQAFRDLSGKWYGHPRFYQLLREIEELHSRKNRDYGGGDPLGNFRLCEQVGIPAWKGCFVRMGDKWSRLTNLIRKEGIAAVKDESITDTARDLAVYSLLFIILWEEAKK